MDLFLFALLLVAIGVFLGIIWALVAMAGSADRQMERLYAQRCAAAAAEPASAPALPASGPRADDRP